MRGSLANDTKIYEYGVSERRMPAGTITVLPRAIAHVAARAVVQVEGVVGLVHRLHTAESRPPLTAEKLHSGVEVHIDDGALTLDVYVVLRYGTPLAEVAQRIEEQARVAVERALGHAPTVRVRVQGVQ